MATLARLASDWAAAIRIGRQPENGRAYARRGIDEATGGVNEGELAVGVDLPDLYADCILKEPLLIPEFSQLIDIVIQVDIGETLNITDVIGAVWAGL